MWIADEVLIVSFTGMQRNTERVIDASEAGEGVQ